MRFLLNLTEILLWAKTKTNFLFKFRGLTGSGKLFYFYVGPTVTDNCAKFHVNVIICDTVKKNVMLKTSFSLHYFEKLCYHKNLMYQEHLYMLLKALTIILEKIKFAGNKYLKI